MSLLDNLSLNLMFIYQNFVIVAYWTYEDKQVSAYLCGSNAIKMYQINFNFDVSYKLTLKNIFKNLSPKLIIQK